jgi:hypothetical protein
MSNKSRLGNYLNSHSKTFGLIKSKVLSRLWKVRAEAPSGTRYMEMQPGQEMYMVPDLVNELMASLGAAVSSHGWHLSGRHENHITKPCLKLLTGL